MFLKVLEFFSNILSSTNIMYVWLHMYLCQIRYYRSLMQMPIINLKFCIVRIFAARNKVSANKIVRFCTTDIVCWPIFWQIKLANFIDCLTSLSTCKVMDCVK